MASNRPDAVPVPVNENVAEPVACSTALAEPLNEPDSEPVETTAPELEPVNDAEPVAVRTVVAEAHLTEPHFVAPQPDVAISYPSLNEVGVHQLIVSFVVLLTFVEGYARPVPGHTMRTAPFAPEAA